MTKNRSVTIMSDSSIPVDQSDAIKLRQTTYFPETI